MISDWGDLQTILAIARTGTLSGAARDLAVSQSTVSRRLQSIERQADGQVFLRGDGRLVASELGQALVAAAEQMARAFDAARDRLDEVGRPVRLATCEAIANAYLVPMLPRWTAAGGGSVDVAVHHDLFALPDDAFDVLVTPLESAPPDMVGSRIGRLDWRFYAAPAYLARSPWQPGCVDLSGHSTIRASGSLAEVEAFRWLARQGGDVAISASSPLAMIDLAAGGAGIAIAPTIMAERDARLVPLDYPGMPASDIWMVARKPAANRSRVAAFLKWSRKQLAAGRRAA
ncbi:LysR family transcriptional regulator [Mesorhizobium marinum]|uniref:LysR family transcriptional regulator n=1 Tax=Mesorhizobium marinum TaxID=3228790 RepID=A0ABV3QU10_9HYPH